jgi:hypothetical protein
MEPYFGSLVEEVFLGTAKTLVFALFKTEGKFGYMNIYTEGMKYDNETCQG